MDERSSIVPGISAAAAHSSARPDDDFSPPPTSGIQVILHLVLLGTIALMAIITFILGLIRGIEVDHHGSTYFMLGLMNLLLVAFESLLVLFVRRGDLEGDKTRSFYVIGGLSMLHSIFTNVVLFN